MGMLRKYRLYLILIAFLISLECCYDPMDVYKYRNWNDIGAVQVYLNPEDTGTSLLETIVRLNDQKVDTFRTNKQLNHSTAVLNFDSCVIYIDYYKGIFIYQRIDGVAGYYLKILGVLKLRAIGPHLLEAETSIGKAVLDIAKPDSVKAISFTFDYPGYAPPFSYSLKDSLYRNLSWGLYPPSEWMLYFDCPENTDKIIYAWRKGKLKKPVCFQLQKR